MVVYKKSSYQLYVNEGRNSVIAELIARRDPTVRSLRSTHETHVRAVEKTRSVLKDLGVRATFRHRHDLHAAPRYELVITLGGDGTFLWASHLVGPGSPIVAINTAPETSVGFFSAGNVDRLERVLSDAVEGRLPRTVLSRMIVRVDGTVISRRVLNDALLCHSCPAATSRYLIRLGRKEEEHRSSGIWVGPAAGSTAAQRSAGGKVLPISSKQIQFVVREPYVPIGSRLRLARGTVSQGKKLVVRSKMHEARLYIDGPRRMERIAFGATIELSVSDEPLTMLGLRSR